ncbi:nucleotidyl transferase AbiEii/AbiGii toxin family protein [Limnobacter sp.]|uniref:nucleotidyl transferase AbiEii/AbiGii toxin family protein n=1 Tax=Limnobacter sp. TaxID=2003368 RepID=UPI002590B387|nr:nucleotidyl transferase AbiEii/AbiGii toxin family protein [Limnobacter sp.]
MLDIAPVIFEEPTFALKGGTALNLFIQDLPRLSVDIDVAFVPHDMGREAALTHIEQALSRARAQLMQRGYSVASARVNQAEEVKLFVSDSEAMVKVEVNYVFRGSIFKPERKALSPKTQALFTTNVELPLLNTAELYGGKMVAALDRQHPRDWFDVWKMRETLGVPPQFVDSFVVYLAGHNRPMHEVLFGKPKGLRALFNAEFEGMTTEPVTLDALEQTSNWFFEALPRMLTEKHKQFLLSLAKAEPQWDLMGIGHLEHLPGISWKLVNLRKLEVRDFSRFKAQHALLAEKFNQL